MHALQMIKNKISMLLKSTSFFKHTFTLMIGTLVGQMILLLTSPLLTRLYTTEEFGVYSIYTSILGVITVIVGLSYEMSIVLPSEDKDAVNLLSVSLLINILISFLILLAVIFYRKNLATLLNEPTLETWLFFLPLSVLLSGWFRTLNYWSIRQKFFSILSQRQVIESSSMSITQFIFGYFDNLFNGLIIGSIISKIVSLISLTYSLHKNQKNMMKHVSLDNMIKLAQKFKKFPLFSTPSSLFNSISVMLPTFVLAYYFDSNVVGLYGLSHRILSLPIVLLSSAIGQVFLPNAVQSHKDHNLHVKSMNLYKGLMLFICVPFVLFSFSAPQLFKYIFGDQWIEAGEYSRYISWWLLLVFVSSPLTVIFDVLGKQKLFFVINIVMFFTRLIVLVYGGINGTPLFTIKLFALTSCALWVLSLFIILLISGNKLSSIIFINLKILTYSTIFIIFAFFLSSFIAKEFEFIIFIIVGIIHLVVFAALFLRNLGYTDIEVEKNEI